MSARVKHCGEFRPFAAMVQLERANELFEITQASPYTQFVVPLRAEWRGRLGAVHHHGRTRVQTVTRASDPFAYELLMAFERRTGVPALLNTSFDDADEPIVCTARDAVRTFLATEIDALILGDVLATRAGDPAAHRPSH